MSGERATCRCGCIPIDPETGLCASCEDVEDYAQLLHRDSCIRRGEIPIWSGRGTNRAYWRRKARGAY